MDKQHRKDLKHDVFVEEVAHSVDWLGQHRQLVTRIGIGVLALAVIGFAVTGYLQRQQRERQQDLYQALRIYNAQVTSEPAGPGLITYTSNEAKQKDATRAFQDLAAKGGEEGAIAKFYLGSMALESGKTADAEKLLKEAADGAGKQYGSVAKLALGQLYYGTGKKAEGEKLIRELINSPTVLVSKEQATIALAEVIAKDNPAEARKLLEPLRTDRSAVSRAALSLLGSISMSNPQPGATPAPAKP